jgi:DNA repair protein RadC
MSDYSFGTITVDLEIEEENRQAVESLHHIEERYSDLRGKEKEHFYALYLNNDNRVIGDKLISLGKSSQTSLDTKDILRTGILAGAEAAILIHNHPSGNSEPSTQDLKATQEIQKQLEQFQIKLLDHVILSRSDTYSMKQEHQLQDKDLDTEEREELNPELVELVEKVRDLDLETIKQLSKPEQFQAARVRNDFDIEDIEEPE